MTSRALGRPEETPITDVQRWLLRLSTVYPEIEQIAVDGIYDAATTEAVTAFQKLGKLPMTGTVDYATWELLHAIYRLVVDLQEETVESVWFPMDYVVEQENSETEKTHYIALMLNRLSQRYENIPYVALGEVYSQNVKNAVKAFQKAAGLKETGNVDKTTWNRLQKTFTAYTDREAIPQG